MYIYIYIYIMGVKDVGMVFKLGIKEFHEHKTTWEETSRLWLIVEGERAKEDIWCICWRISI